MIDVQFYKQAAGAVDDVGAVIEPGWYWVQTRDASNGPPIPFGTSTGPFRTKRDAMRDYRNPPPGNKGWAWKEAARRSVALDGPYSVYHREDGYDYIVRTAESAAPDPTRWQRVATFSNGELTFKTFPPTLTYGS